MGVNTYKLVENEYTGIFDRVPLEGVNLSYDCLQYSCAVGETEYNFAQKGDIASYFTTFPYCVGAILKGSKPNYKEGWARVVSSPGKEVEINLTPVISIPANNIKIVKHRLLLNDENNNNNNLPILSPGKEVSAEEYASIQIAFDKKESPSKANAEIYSTYYPNNHFHESKVILSQSMPDLQQSAAENKLEFLAEADFTYTTEITLFKSDAEEGLITAGYKYNWTVPWSSLSQAKQVTFHVLELEDDSKEGLVEFLSSLEQNSALLPVPELR